MVASTLVGIIAQRMIRRICTRCAIPVEPTTTEKRILEEEIGEVPGKLFKGNGCSVCGHTGFRGRTGLYEILVVSEDIRRMLLDNTSAGEMRAKALEEGMVTMKKDGLLKVREGITTVNEVMRTVFSFD